MERGTEQTKQIDLLEQEKWGEAKQVGAQRIESEHQGLWENSQGLYHQLSTGLYYLARQTKDNLGFSARHYPNELYEAADDRIPVILVHGFADHQRGMDGLKRNLEEQITPPYGPVYAVYLDGVGLKIEDYAAQLIAQIREFTQKKFVIVGHSMGGITAAFAAEQILPAQSADSDIEIVAIWSLGTPWHGCNIAKLSIFSNARQMMPRSEFLAELRNSVSQSLSRYNFVSFARDELVSPESALPFDDRSRHYLLPNHGHASGLYNVNLAQHIVSRLPEQREALSEAKSRLVSGWRA